jgi:hypothetical protein
MVVSGEKPHAPGSVQVALGTQIVRVQPQHVALKDEAGKETTIANDVVFTMLGREAPLEFFRRSRIPIRGEWTAATYASFALFFLFCVFLYNWKAGGAVNQFFQKRNLFPYNTAGWFQREWAAPPPLRRRSQDSSGDTRDLALKDPGFYYSLAYRVCVLASGIRRIRRRKTPYVTAQTITLTAVQWIPLFLPSISVLPLLGYNGLFESGFGRTFADHFSRCQLRPRPQYWRRLVSSSPGRSSSGTSSRRSRCGGGLAIAFLQTSSSSRS